MGTQNRTEESYLEGRRFATSLHPYMEPLPGIEPGIPDYKTGVIVRLTIEAWWRV